MGAMHHSVGYHAAKLVLIVWVSTKASCSQIGANSVGVLPRLTKPHAAKLVLIVWVSTKASCSQIGANSVGVYQGSMQPNWC